VDKNSLTYSAFALNKAYKAFFNHFSNKPKFKSKHRSKKAYTTCLTNNNIQVGENWIKLPKVKTVKAQIHRKASQYWRIKGACVTMECDGNYYCSVLYEKNTPDLTSQSRLPVISPANSVGLDFCVNGLYIDSNGNRCDNHIYFSRSYDKLKKEQHKLSRKCGAKKGEKKSVNYIKQLNKVQKAYRKIAHQLNDHLHKVSTEIANQYDIVCVEDLDLNELKKKHMGMGLFKGQRPLCNGYGTFTQYLSYKLEDRNKYLIKVDRWYPSSKICSMCGSIKKITIQERNYCCPNCKASMNRDVNAAINIRNEGLRILLSASPELLVGQGLP